MQGVFNAPSPCVQYQNKKNADKPTRDSLNQRMLWNSSSRWLVGILYIWVLNTVNREGQLNHIYDIFMFFLRICLN